jgi:hypothetical protein
MISLELKYYVVSSNILLKLITSISWYGGYLTYAVHAISVRYKNEQTL